MLTLLYRKCKHFVAVRLIQRFQLYHFCLNIIFKYSSRVLKMENLLDKIIGNLTAINWEGPAAFVVAILSIFAFLRKFFLVLLIILTIVIGWGAEDLILLNMETNDKIINAPLLVYVVGGIAVFFLALHSFFKSD